MFGATRRPFALARARLRPHQFRRTFHWLMLAGPVRKKGLAKNHAEGILQSSFDCPLLGLVPFSLFYIVALRRRAVGSDQVGKHNRQQEKEHREQR